MSSWKAPLVFGTVRLYKHSCITTTAIMHTQIRRHCSCSAECAPMIMQIQSFCYSILILYSYIPHAPQTYCLFIYMHQPGGCTVQYDNTLHEYLLQSLLLNAQHHSSHHYNQWRCLVSTCMQTHTSCLGM